MMTYITQSVSSQSLSLPTTTATHNNNRSLKSQSSSRCSQRKRQKEMRFVGRYRSFQIILLAHFVCLILCAFVRSNATRERLSSFEGKSDESFQKSPQNLSQFKRHSERIRARQRDTLHAQNTSPIREMIVKNVQFKWGKEIYAVDVDLSLIHI